MNATLSGRTGLGMSAASHWLCDSNQATSSLSLLCFLDDGHSDIRILQQCKHAGRTWRGFSSCSGPRPQWLGLVRNHKPFSGLLV